MNIELHLLVNGVDKGPLPSYQSLNISPVFCDIGAISFKYPRAGKRFRLIDGLDELEIVPWINGVPQPRFGGYVNQISSDDVADAGMVDFAGQMYLRRLDEIRAYPKNWPDFDPTDPSWLFTAQNAGQIAGSLLNAAANRGTGTDLTWGSFNHLTDSNGQPWTKAITLEVKPNATILDVLDSMFSNNMIEFEMVGKDLRIYNSDTLGADRTAQAKPLTFRRGRDVSDSPRKVSSRDVSTVMLAAGKEDKGLYHEEADAGAIAGRRRIEGFVSNGNIVESGTLDAFTEAQLARNVNPKMEKTHGLALSGKKTPKPIENFEVGDWAFSDTGKGLEKLRVKQWVVTVNADGKITGSVTLNDLIAEQNARLSKRIDGIIGGSTLTGESKAIDVLPGEVVDGEPPAAPSALGLQSAPFMNAEGQVFAQVTATWPQVTTNTDGTILSDLAGYTLRWSYSQTAPDGWNYIDQRDTGTIMQFSPVAPATQIWAQVRAFDKYSNAGPWSPLVSHTTQDDATAPEKPATPTADNYMGLIRVTYNGKTLSGAAWAPDVQFFQVHASTISDFTPDASTWIDTLTDAGSAYIDPGYGQTRYVKIVPVDRTGNKGPASNQASATTQQILSDDIFAGAVGTAQLADLVVTTAKIQNLAVNDAKIGSVNAAKITAGVINAELTVSGRIATALTGKRSEMNGIGFQSWDDFGNLTVSLTGIDNLLMGIYKTSISGRRIEIGAGGNSGEIKFIGPDGRMGHIRGFTATLGDPGDESIEFGIDVSGTWGGWNGLQVNLDEEAFLETGFVAITGGGNGTGTKGINFRWASTRGNATSPPFVANRMIISSTTIDMLSTASSIRLRVNDSGVQFYPNGNGRIEIVSGIGANMGAQIFLANEGGTLGAYFRYQYVADAYAHRFEMRNGQDNAYFNSLAATHYDLSDETTKTNIRELEGSARAKMKGVRGKLFSYRHEDESDTDTPMRFGIVAQDLPPELAQPTGEGVRMVSPMSVAAMAINMIHEIEEELAELRELVTTTKKGKKS